MCSIFAGWLHASCCLDCRGLVSDFDFAPAFEGHSDETTDLGYVLYFVVFRWGVHFCGWRIRRLAGQVMFACEEWDCWLASTTTVAVWTEVARIGHRATRDVRWTTEEQALQEALHFRLRRGRRRLKLNASLRHDETSLCS